MICGGRPPRQLSAINALFVNLSVDELFVIYQSMLVDAGGGESLKAFLSTLKDMAIAIDAINTALQMH